MLRLMRLALLAAVAVVVLAEVTRWRRDVDRRAALARAPEREARVLSPAEAAWVPAIEGWLDAEARLDGPEVVDDRAREPGWLGAMAASPWVYLRGVDDELTSVERRLQMARSSALDPFVLCLRRPPDGDDQALRAAQAAYRLHGPRFEDAVAGVVPAGDVLFALRPLMRSWPQDVRQAEGSLGLTLLERELAMAGRGRGAALAAASLRHVVLVIDRHREQPPRAGGRGLMASMQPSDLLDLEYLPHEAQVTVIDLRDGRALVRLRRWLDERPLVEREARVNVGWAQSCRLALEVHARLGR